MIQAVKDPDPGVREYAIVALANMRIVFAPLNAGVNAIARFSVNPELLADTELLPRLIAHELPCRVEALPNT